MTNKHIKEKRGVPFEHARMQRRDRPHQEKQQVDAAGATSTTTGSSFDQAVASIDIQLANIADQVALLAPVHEKLLKRVERAIQVAERFENEASSAQADAPGAEGRSRTF